NTRVGRAPTGELGDDRAVHDVEDLVEQGRIDVQNGREGAHAAGVRSCVTLADTAVIPCRRKRDDVLAVDQGEHRQLFALQQLLDDQRVSKRSCGPERLVEL